MNINVNDISTLVIESNNSMRQIIVSMLRTMGIKNIVIANSEKQCLDLITTEKIKLVICGWAPPKLDALAILKKIRDSEKTLKITFIIVSTIIEQDQIREAVLNGVSEYIVPLLINLFLKTEFIKH